MNAEDLIQSVMTARKAKGLCLVLTGKSTINGQEFHGFRRFEKSEADKQETIAWCKRHGIACEVQS